MYYVYVRTDIIMWKPASLGLLMNCERGVTTKHTTQIYTNKKT